jgi:hypothetical protein
MRRFIATSLLTFAAAAPLAAQQPAPTVPAGDQVLVGLRPYSHGGWFGVDTRITSLVGADAIIAGVRGGWLINRRLSVGLAAYGNVTTRINTGYTLPSGRTAGLEFAYGGLELGYITRPAKLLHMSLWSVVGGGAVSFRDHAVEPGRSDLPVDGLFVVEPGVSTEVNVSRRVRIALGTSYRIIDGARLSGLERDALDGFATSLTFKVGKF